MAQYKEIKSQNTDSILFFRLGDFYEMFFEDAVTASKELGLTLTSRNREKDQDVPLAGIPYHSASSYIAKLVNKGYKVAICEQIENPKTAEGNIVKRAVVRVITPGTVIDTDYLDEKSNNYLLGIKIVKDMAGIAYIDITTGEFNVSEVELRILLGEINKIAPREIVLDKSSYELLQGEIKNQTFGREILISEIPATIKNADFLKEYFKITSLESFNLVGREIAVDIAGMVLKYVNELQRGNSIPVRKINYLSAKNIVELNITTQKNLELVENSREKSSYGTLFWILDKCLCSMGSRLLKNFIKNPTKNVEEILSRQNRVEFFMKEVMIREDVREYLKDMYDVERILGKLVMGTENGRDIIALKKSVEKTFQIYKVLKNNPILQVDENILQNIFKLIDERLNDEQPFSIREGGMIKRGFSSELDELYDISTKGKDYVFAIENREKERTGIKNLKIKYNKVFGYFIEVTSSNLNMVPADYIRKQTLSNAERYIVPDLKEYEEKILHAKERIESLEYELFKELSAKLFEQREIIQDFATQIAYVDVMSTFAECALQNKYVKPEISEEYSLEIIGGRHPVVENLIKKEKFVKNDIHLDNEKNIIILTGPNMSGKSTYMKQVALIIIMAHIGSFVPADFARISIVDKIFTRIGASDDLVSGQSTFMLEMSEMASIVNSATEKSFIILDEIGRGTSTFDGISLATSITEYIHNNLRAKTIFATHYHELTQLEDELFGVANYRIEVKEDEKEITFLRKIVKGGADKSYGIEVARVAGLPQEILDRSKNILEILENQREIIERKMEGSQLNLFGNVLQEKEAQNKITNILDDSHKVAKIIVDKLQKLDMNTLTPMDAMLKLNELKKILEN
ncbi:MAG: DNA mismatch repair protein MutS [Fusobacteriaceae bacterium]